MTRDEAIKIIAANEGLSEDELDKVLAVIKETQTPLRFSVDEEYESDGEWSNSGCWDGEDSWSSSGC
jgi:hypothetical protein